MSNVLGNLNPHLLWKHFEEICRIPHPSRHEKELAQYIVNFAKQHNLTCNVDSFGNVVVSKEASPGKENLTPVVLQGHIDMVPEKNADVSHNFEKDPIQCYVDGDWVKAKGTTLGSDNGIGVAAALAVLEANDIEHGPIEALFTLDEETGLNGAQALQAGFVNSDILMNLDSEEDGALYIGCSGGQNTFVKFKYESKEIPEKTVALDLSVTGLKGGHSGLEIQVGKGNSIKLMVRLLHNLHYNYGIRLVSFAGGSKHNAIPRESFASIRVSKKSAEDIKGYVEHYNEIVKAELASVEPTLVVACADSKSKSKVMDKSTTKNLIDSLYAVPNGVIKMSADIENLVETSTNLAVVVTNKKYVEVTLSHRSSVESERKDIANSIAALFRMAKAEVVQGDGYPGWKPDINSPVLKVMKKVFHEKYGKEPEVKAIHAGLECGIIKERYPHMDMISFGPTIFGAHSPDERVQISTVEKFWDNLVAALKNIPAK